MTAQVVGATWQRQGVTREVFLIGRWALKVPKLTKGWRMFLSGLLANMQERDFGRNGWEQLCPVVFSLPGGWLVVMRRASVLTLREWHSFDAEDFIVNGPGAMLPVENKPDSFGRLDGRIVAIDYGN